MRGVPMAELYVWQILIRTGCGCPAGTGCFCASFAKDAYCLALWNNRAEKVGRKP